MIALQASYITEVEDKSILSAEYRLPLLAKIDPPAAQLLVTTVFEFTCVMI